MNKTFLFLSLMFISISNIFAVSLPTNAYVPSYTSSEAEASSMFGTGSSELQGGTLINYGSSDINTSLTGASDPTVCDYVGPDPTACTNCCLANVFTPCMDDGGDYFDCAADHEACVTSCGGYSLPLDGGVYILLMMLFSYVGFRFYLQGRKA